MKTLIISLICVLILAVGSWIKLEKPFQAIKPSPLSCSYDAEEMKQLQARVSQLEAAVKKLERDKPPRVIPLSMQR